LSNRLWGPPLRRLQSCAYSNGRTSVTITARTSKRRQTSFAAHHRTSTAHCEMLLAHPADLGMPFSWTEARDQCLGAHATGCPGVCLCHENLCHENLRHENLRSHASAR
jgi:hypothetical protein